MIEQLKSELAHRDCNIAVYRLNINKYERMLAKLGRWQPFARRLRKLVKTEREQCAIEELTREVTAEILAEMEKS